MNLEWKQDSDSDFSFLEHLQGYNDWRDQLDGMLKSGDAEMYIEHRPTGFIIYTPGCNPVSSINYSEFLQVNWVSITENIDAEVGMDFTREEFFENELAKTQNLSQLEIQEAAEILMLLRLQCFLETFENFNELDKSEASLLEPRITYLICELWAVLMFCQKSKILTYVVPENGIVLADCNFGDPYINDGKDFALEIVKFAQSLVYFKGIPVLK